MAQPPVQFDAIRIFGDSTLGTRLIQDDETTGSLRFVDHQIPGGINLNQIVGLQGVEGVVVVGTGPGASKDTEGNTISTIQQAIDAVPFTSSASNPWLILVMPGLYVENVVLDRDGVHLVALGNVELRNPGAAGDTFTVVQGPFSIPRKTTIQGLLMRNTAASGSCVEVSSARFATGTVTVSGVVLVGDTVSVDGITLTAVSGAAAAGQFTIGATFAQTAQNLADAIEDSANGLTSIVRPFVSGAVVTLRSFQYGLVGNAITLATSVALTFVLSGATLAGGLDASAGSEVAEDGLLLLDCSLVAEGVTGFQISAASVNNLFVKGGSCEGSSSGSTLLMEECARLEVFGTSGLQRLQLDYDSGGTLPSIVGSSYQIHDVDVAGSLSSTLSGDGSFNLANSRVRGTSTLSGDRNFEISSSVLAVVQVLGTASASFYNTARGSLTGSATAIVAETVASGTLAFVASASEVLTFAVPQPDTDYTVMLESSIVPAAITDIPVVSAKTAADFTVTFGASQTTTLRWTVLRTSF